MQPDFARQLAFNNVVFRIPTPVFGLGLVENTTDATLRANLAATRDARYRLGIGGRFNTSGNDGTITRFGWKAQNKSLLIFAGEAYNVEQGVTNEVFPDERAGVDGCVFNSLPEDVNGVSNEDEGEPVLRYGELRHIHAPASTTGRPVQRRTPPVTVPICSTRLAVLCATHLR